MIVFPPADEVILINGRRLAGIIAHMFELEYGPWEMLSEKAVKRVQIELIGEAANGTAPVLAGPPNPLQDHDPLLLAVHYHMVKRHEDNLGSYKEYSTAVMRDISKTAPAFGIPVVLIPNYTPVFGKRLIALTPQFLELGLKVEYRHRNKGTYFEISWMDGYPKDESGDGGKPPSPTPSSPKDTILKSLQRRDGRDVGELLSRVKALNPETKEPQP